MSTDVEYLLCLCRHIQLGARPPPGLLAYFSLCVCKFVTGFFDQICVFVYNLFSLIREKIVGLAFIYLFIFLFIYFFSI